jgi:hypothetical protein
MLIDLRNSTDSIESILRHIRSNVSEDRDIFVISMSIMNIIDRCEYFEPTHSKSVNGSDFGYNHDLILIGYLYGIVVYLDLVISENIVKLTFSKQKKREHRLMKLLNASKIPDVLSLEFIF